LRVPYFSFFAVIVFASVQVPAQEKRTVGAAVNYISSGSVYLDAGREKGLAQGDTVILRRGNSLRGTGVIIAVSSSSSAIHLITPGTADAANKVALGDSAFVTKNVVLQAPEPLLVAAQPIKQTADLREGGPRASAGPLNNIISGRVALQYAQAGMPGGAPDFSQPSLYTRLNVGRLFGTGMNLSFFARTYQNAALSTFDEESRFRFRLYDLSLTYDEPGQAIGGSVGRVTSIFMGGLGQIDGAQVYVKGGNFTVGALAGFQPDYRTSRLSTEQQKGALFLHYGWEGEQFTRWDATVAYGRQLYNGKLDRDFLYIQNSARLGMDLFLYQSSEIDLHVMEDGVQKKKFQLTNTYATLSYVPLSWLSASAGFDATRNIYLLESMKSFPDTLFDHTLKEGYRGAISFRLPFNVMLTGTGRFRPASGSERQTRSLGGGVRMADLAGTGINAGAQYSDLTGVYTNGNDLTLDADGWITTDLSLMLRYDRYKYTVFGQQSQNVSTTGSAMLQWRISRSLFWMINYDRIWDSLRDSQRLMCELGLRF
jgi:hypothetical protein